ncbi:hypothetical protein LTS10_011543 [Elasticomyces elasticus]|nr:hypothetical protein LTS10_011543 [Elasticomyces elasticus]
MPRVRSTNQPTYAESPAKKVTIPLNDDLHEKAARLQSRKLLASKQLDTLKAAASPHRSKTHRASIGENGGAPHTPSQDENRVAFDDGVTPMKRVPLLANFEEWMKMATDNKINAANSWNFALIDYFHDMSLLREGDGVNFQKASCTLDGCVKIYTSRVDSVATETGKLLSGLAMEGGGRKGRKEGGDEEGEGSEVEGEEGKKKGRKKVNRSAEATLATSFEVLRLKKMELEFSVDPLFKKAAADFDEGGAKGLLMNHLSIDNTGRIVFDSSDDVQDDANEAERRDSLEPDSTSHAEIDTEPAQPEDGPVNISALASRFFPDLGLLDEQVICPSLQTFELGAGESSSLDLPFLKAPENWRDDHPENLPTHGGDDGEEAGIPDNNPAFSEDDDDPNGLGATFDAGPETGFGEGGEAWARDAALHAQPPLHNIQDGEGEGGEGGEVGVFDTNAAAYGITLHHRPGAKDEENILNYFDTALSKNWAGPEHWKIARIKSTLAGAGAEKKVRKEKEPFEIDFLAPMTAELAKGLQDKVEGGKGISLPRAQWRSKGRNLLPDDKHFNSKDLLKLFLKPKARLGSRRVGGGGQGKGGRVVGAGGEVMGDVDEAFWAANGGLAGGQAGGMVGGRHPMDDDEDGGAQGDYDANFFQDDGLPLPHGGGGEDEDEGLEFADAVEYAVAAGFDAAGAGAGGGGGPDGAGIDSLGLGGTQETAVPGTFGAELVSQSRRVRPEYVQYARTAKKVDVRRLKENMWRGMGLTNATSINPPSAVPQTPSQPPAVNLAKDDGDGLMFTDIMNGLQTVYPKQQMGDISTSYGFICLLHLANEKGLVVENVEGWGDLRVRIDGSARDLEHDGT